MLLVLSILYVLVVAVIAWKYLFLRPHRVYSHIASCYSYENEAFHILWLFIVTTMVEFQNNILFWGVYILFILLLNVKYKSGVYIEKPCLLYYLFMLWVICTLVYSEHLYSGIMMIVKLSMPLFFYYLTKKAIYSTHSVWLFFEKIAPCLYVYALLGVVSKLTGGGYLSTYHYFGMPLSVIPLALYWRTRNNEYIVLFFMCLIPPVMALKRTPLLGIGVSTFFFLFCMYRLKAIIPSVAAMILGIVGIFSIPGFKERIFYSDVAFDIALLDLFNWDIFNYISTSGRSDMWNFVIEEFYIGNEIKGCGLGTLKGFLASPQNVYQASFTLLHNDWLHLLCETGKIGVSLLALFYLSFLFKTFKYSSSKYPKNIRIISACCSGVIVSTNIHMYFENCVNSIIFFMPFVLFRIFQVYINDYKSKIQP